jgi:hypothetical protein
MPIDATPFAHGVAAVAATRADEPTLELLIGEETATVAEAGTAHTTQRSKDPRSKNLMVQSLKTANCRPSF